MSPSLPVPKTHNRTTPLILLIYPVILVLGGLFSVLSPSASPSQPSAAFSPGLAADINTPQSPQALNYFARKDNIINLYFVKIGWVWTTLAFAAIHAISTFSSTTLRRPTSGRQQHPLIQASIRYLLITFSWILVTQWFFGPALIDRSFTSTGGQCLLPGQLQHEHLEQLSSSAQTVPGQSEPPVILSSIDCKLSGGKWQGGHDISGHFFMLVLSSAALFLELSISEHQNSKQVAADAPSKTTATKKDLSTAGNADGIPVTPSQAKVWGLYLVWGVIILDIWMLFMTAIWFHTLFEKISGLVLATATVWAIYFSPRQAAVADWLG